MRLSPVARSGALSVFLLLGAADARAELIQWSYQWSRSPTQVQAEGPGSGSVLLTDGGLKSAAGSSNLIAANLQAHSTASRSNPDVFANKPYALSLFLQDQDSGKSGTMSFTGAFNGILTAESSIITNTFTGPTTQALTLGDHLYTVTIGPYSALGPTGAVNLGSIGARVEVTALFHTPEPSSGVLALLGTVCLGFGRRLRRRARA